MFCAFCFTVKLFCFIVVCWCLYVCLLFLVFVLPLFLFLFVTACVLCLCLQNITLLCIVFCFVLPIILLNCLFDCCVFVFVCALFTCSSSFSFPVACMSHSLSALPISAEHHNASCGVVFYFVLPILLPNCLFDWCVFEFVVCLLFSVLPSHIINPRCPWDAKFLPMGLS